MAWFVYILECADNTLYTGVTTDIDRRLHEHNNSKAGARYTRGKRPVKVVYQESAAHRSAACKREYEIKHLSRAQKQQLLHAAKLLNQPPKTGAKENSD